MAQHRPGTAGDPAPGADRRPLPSQNGRPGQRLRRSGWVAGLAGCLVLVVGVATAGASQLAGQSDKPAGGRLAATCADHEGGFAVSYPDDWHTTRLHDGLPCRLFGPEPVDIGTAPSDHVEAAVFVDVMLDSYDDRVDDVSGDSPITETVQRSEHVIDGRRATRSVQRHTADGLYPEGTRSVVWIVEVDDRAIVLSTYDATAPGEFERNVEVLDAMATTVRPVRVTAEAGTAS